jgi:prevent-host-death family protein
MTEITISRFKATCLAVLADVGKSGVPVRVTKRGKPIAEIVPARPATDKPWMGCMSDSIEIVGDIVGRVGAFDGWGDLQRAKPRRLSSGK